MNLLKTKAFNNQQLQWNSISNGNITHYNGIIISTTNVTNFNGILEYYLQISLTYNGIVSTNVTYFNGINTKQLRLSYNNQSDIK